MLLKTYSKIELEELINAVDTYFLFNYDFNSLFSRKQAIEVELFLRLREDILKFMME